MSTSMSVLGSKQMFSVRVLSCWTLSPALYLTVVETESVTGLKLVKEARLLAIEPQGTPCLSLPSSGITSMHHT